MSIPTKKEINPYDDLDAIEACKTFFGKDLVAAEKMFEARPSGYADDLLFMGPVAFRYYVRAAIRFLLNESATGQAGLINSFCCALHCRWENDLEELRPVAGQLAHACGYIAEHFDEYNLVPKTEEEWAQLRQAHQKVDDRSRTWDTSPNLELAVRKWANIYVRRLQSRNRRIQLATAIQHTRS
jgi:hypothetical protein